ncbi:hypothetical protein CPB84DRAFT_1752703 [Gymnopilus junonius]|uniref:Uncharacterized protein n=1 Tax=Gymnopilus junonius TaxID=109634 RepID=A0A9P5N8W7_GYMJU|nr:hypothetical protein CPB84DRAFT_1752703 [Gymnopilus junonius]
MFSAVLLNVLITMLRIASAATKNGTNVFSVISKCSTESVPYSNATIDAGSPYAKILRKYLVVAGTMLPVWILIFLDAIKCSVFLVSVVGSNGIQCINPLGTTVPAFPSATTGLIPSSTPILGSDPNIIYSPPQAWKVSDAKDSCTQSPSIHLTDSINATISFNYTGPSVMLHLITSSQGGIFLVKVDGFNTTDFIDTRSGPQNVTLPTCYPLQYPPFLVPPPGYQSRSSHSMTLVHLGISPSAPEGTNTSTVQFDTYAIPDLETALIANSSGRFFAGLRTFNIYFFLIWLAFTLYFLL